jgi:hypothetical protein
MLNPCWLSRPLAQIPKSPLNPPILGDFESISNSCSPQNWGARGARDDSRKRSSILNSIEKSPYQPVIFAGVPCLLLAVMSEGDS